MQSRLSQLFLGAQGAIWRIGAAVVAATFMLFITEIAYRRQIHSLDHGSGEASLPPMQLKMDLLFEEKLAGMQDVLRRHDSGNREAALDMVRSGIGREIMQRMRLAFDANMAHRNQLIADGLV